jgi:outer membrane protein assembly factor BamB
MLSKTRNILRPSRIALVALLLVSVVAAIGCMSQAPSRGWSGPLVDDNVVYVGTIDGKVIALDATDVGGDRLVWAKEVADPTGGGGFLTCGRFSQPMGVYGTPVVKDGRVYVGGYDEAGSVLYIRIDDGSMSDAFETGGAIVGSPVIDGDTLYVGSSNGKLYALSLDLNEKWSFRTGDKIWSTAEVSNGAVYVGSADHNLYALDAATGREIWHFETEGAILSTPLVVDGTVYIGSNDRKFYAIEAVTEAERAEAAARQDGQSAPGKNPKAIFDGAGNWFWTQALAYNGEIWVGCLDHNVYVLNAESLGEIRRYETEGIVQTPPVLLEGRVIVGSEDGNVYAFDPENKDAGAEILYPFEVPILAPMYPDAGNGILYIHAQDGTHTLYALRVATGEIVWSFRTDKING